jgi:hypothetical protein
VPRAAAQEADYATEVRNRQIRRYYADLRLIQREPWRRLVRERLPDLAAKYSEAVIDLLVECKADSDSWFDYYLEGG